MRWAVTHTDKAGILRSFEHVDPDGACLIVGLGCGDPKCRRHQVIGKVDGKWFVRGFPNFLSETDENACSDDVQSL